MKAPGEATAGARAIFTQENTANCLGISSRQQVGTAKVVLTLVRAPKENYVYYSLYCGHGSGRDMRV